jgi:hypothetical protein
MKKSIATFFVLFLLCLTALPGCGKPPQRAIIATQLDRLFQKNFVQYKLPDVNKIMKNGRKKNFLNATYDDVWASIIKTIIQKGAIVRVSRETGVIVAVAEHPFAIFVEQNLVVTVYLLWLDEMYQNAENPKIAYIDLLPHPYQKEEIITRLFDNVEAQLTVRKKLWYLFEEKADTVKSD